jgi:hypothetical protein
MKQILSNDQIKVQTDIVLSTLKEQLPDFISLEKYKNDTKIYHKDSAFPKHFWLFISVNVRVKKIFVGVINYSRRNTGRILEIYEQTPFDVRGRLSQAYLYTKTDSFVKFDEIFTNDKIEEIKNLVEFYKKTYAEFLNVQK